MSIESKLDEVLEFVAGVKRPDPDAPVGFWGWLTQARAWKQRALRAEAEVDLLRHEQEIMGEVLEHSRSWNLALTAVAAQATPIVKGEDPRERFPRKQA